MVKKVVYIFLFDGFSDWELSYLTPELNKSNLYEMKTFSIDGKMVHSMGGLKIQPDLAMSGLNSTLVALLVLPGGDAWEEGKLREITELVRDLNNRKIPVAAICGATVLLADLGLLNDRRHTSNAREYLKAVAPGYSGMDQYEDEYAINDQNIITASGIAPIEFAREVFRELKIFDDDTLDKWYELFKNGVYNG